MASVLPKKNQLDTWLITVSLPFDGVKYPRYTETFHGTPAAARRRGRQLEAEKEAGKLRQATGHTVASWAEEWLAIRRRDGLATVTLHNYAIHLRLRIIPALGAMPLEALQPRHIITWLENIGESGPGMRFDKRGDRLSGATLLKHFRTLSILLQDAVYRQLIPGNPCRAVRPPDAERREARHYDDAGVDALLAALADEPPRVRAIVLLALTTGLRRGELVALTWDDLDLRAFTVNVERAMNTAPGAGRATKGPKTATSRRTVPVPTLALVELLDWRAEQYARAQEIAEQYRTGRYRARQAKPHDTTHICTSQHGKWLHPDSANYLFDQFLARHHLQRLTLHGIRHTNATQLLNSGVPLHDVSRLLGHASIPTTANFYIHPTPDRAAANVFNNRLSIKFSTQRKQTP